MEFWSAGMGKKNLVLGLSKTEYEVEGEGEGEEMILSGTVDSPADWNYRVTMTTGDWANILEIATSPKAAQFVVNSIRMGLILRMALSISRFCVLLATFRTMKALGVSGRNKVKEGQG